MKKLAILFILITLCSACSNNVDTLPEVSSQNSNNSQQQETDKLKQFKSAVQQDLLNNSSGESISSQIPEHYGTPFLDALVTLDTKRGNQVGFVPIFKKSSFNTEAILVVVGNERKKSYALFARGHLNQLQDIFADEQYAPDSFLLATIFGSYDQEIFNDQNVDLQEIIGARKQGEIASSVSDLKSDDYIKSEWVEYEVCWLMFAGSNQDPYEEYTGTDCYIEYRWEFEITPNEGIILDYTPFGGGGGTFYVKLSYQIFDSNLDPCMRVVMNDIRSLKNGVGSLLQKFIGQSKVFNWELVNGNLGESVNASTAPYSKANNSIKTTFDKNKFKNASDLSIARTILHESIHAYMQTELANYRPAFEDTFKQLMTDFKQMKYGDDLNRYHHEEMTNRYIGGIADALQEYGSNRGYDLPRKFYEDLAWGGLKGTSAFNDPNFLSNEDRARINNVISSEQSGNTTTQKGTKTGC